MAQNAMVTGALVVVVVGVLVYLVDPTVFGLLKRKQGFEGVCPDGYFESSDGTCVPSGYEGFEDEEEFQAKMATAVSNGNAAPGQTSNPGAVNAAVTMGNPNVASGDMKTGAPLTQGFADLAEGPADFGSSSAPAGCYPRDQLTPSELLPKDKNSVWAEQNPMGPGSLKGKNFLSAGALIGVNTVGQSLRNANWQLRSEPPNPQVPVSIWSQSTIAPDTNRRPLEIN